MLTRSRLAVFGSLTLVLTGCGPSISEEYGGDDCFFSKLAFTGDDTVYITAFGVEQAASYRIDGDRVIVSAGDGQSMVFTRNGNNLETSFLGDRMVCSKQ